MKKRTLSELVWNALATYGLSLFWITVAVSLIRTALAEGAVLSGLPHIDVIFHWIPYFPALDSAIAASVGLQLFMTLVFAPVVEEAMFRFLPLTVFGQDPEKRLAAIIVICGVFFGLAHGHPLKVFIQGFFGMMLGFLYVRNKNSMLTGYLSCVVVHFMYNYTVIMT